MRATRFPCRHIREHDVPECLIYANPGVPNAGMNSLGLCLMSNTVYSCDADFTKGLPSCVIVRELLRRRSLQEARHFLEGGVMSIPFNYMLLHNNAIANMEGTSKKVRQSNVENEVQPTSNSIAPPA